jgi:hypothetical protein
MNFPLSVPVAMLEPAHPDYDAELITEIGDFYYGGSRMDARKQLYLKARASDKNREYQQSRFLSTIYNNYFGQQLDAIAAEIVEDGPCFEVANSTDPRAAFWLERTEDCDGRGNDSTLVAQNCVLDILKFRRAYLFVDVADVAPLPGEDMAAAKARGRFAGRFVHLPAESIDRWQETAGRLDWVRSHVVELAQPSPVVNTFVERHTWAYFTPAGIYIYTAERPAPTGTLLPAEWPKGATANLTVKPNVLGVCPVVAMTANFSLADRLLPTARALFNLESARAFLLEVSALTKPVLITEKTDATLIDFSELSALSPGLNGDFKFVGPPSSVFEALEIACKDLRANFDRIVSNLDQHGAALVQNPRQSAEAKSMDKEPKQILLSLFAMPVQDGWDRAAALLADLRGETDLQPMFCGLEDDDCEDVTEALDNAERFLALGPPPIARATAMRELCKTYLPQMSDDDQRTLERQLKASATVAAPISTTPAQTVDIPVPQEHAHIFASN